MLSSGGGVSIARRAIRGENRFYNPPQMRRMQQEAQLQQQQREKQPREEEEEEDKERRAAATTRKSTESKNQAVSASELSVSTSDSSSSGRVQRDGSNLDRFLEHTTPIVPARLLPTCHTYFLLEDLWDSFAEWSAYGAGVPLRMHEGDSTVQYYVPYLSGIQLYVDPSESSREPVADNEVSSERSRLEKLSNNAKTVQNAVDSSLQDQSIAGSFSSGESDINHPKERLLFEYLEYELPFRREPLTNKILDLASRFPELMTYRSCDLSPSSWISVSWYPIYRIPVGPTLQNLDACFLTFHSLSTPSPQILGKPYMSEAGAMNCSDSEPSTKLPLPTFGLASYKLKVSVWNPNRAQESQKITYLLQAADKWLKRLQVEHPDYKFFTK